MSNNVSKRRTVFINKAFQGRFIMGVFILILFSGICSAMTIYMITGGDLQSQTQTAHVNILNSLERLGVSIFIGNLVALMIAGSLAIFMVLYASHKIAGPLYRFEKLCEQIGDDQLDSMTVLRENDQLQELGRAFTVMATKLRNRKDQRLQCVKKMQIQIEQLQRDADSKSSQLELLAQLSQTVTQLKD